MIVVLFFRHTLSLSSSPSVAISHLIATSAEYFGIPTGSAERIVDSVRHTFFDVGNLHGIGFLASSGETIVVSDNRAAKISFLSIHSTVFARALDRRFPSIGKFTIAPCPSSNTASTKLASDLTTDVASLRKKDVFDNLASRLTTGVASLRKKDVLDKLACGLTTDVASLRKKGVLNNLASRLTTDVASLRKNDVLDNLACGLTTDVVFLRKKDVLDILASRLTTDVASLCKKDVLDKLASCLTTDVVFL